MSAQPQSDELVLHELYAAHQLFRQLGFPGANLFVGQAIDGSGGPYHGKVCVSCHLRWREKEFIYTVAPVASFDRFTGMWVHFIEAANTGKLTQDWLKERYEQAYIFQVKATVISALHLKGISPPFKLE